MWIFEPTIFLKEIDMPVKVAIVCSLPLSHLYWKNICTYHLAIYVYLISGISAREKSGYHLQPEGDY